MSADLMWGDLINESSADEIGFWFTFRKFLDSWPPCGLCGMGELVSSDGEHFFGGDLVPCRDADAHRYAREHSQP